MCVSVVMCGPLFRDKFFLQASEQSRPSSLTDRASACMDARATLSNTARKQRLNVFRAESFVPLSPYLFGHKVSGSYVHACPRPCVEHLSVGQAFHPPTPRDTHTLCALTPILAVCPPHACLRRRDWAVSITCTKARVFLYRLHVKAHRVLCLIAFTSEKHDRKNWR